MVLLEAEPNTLGVIIRKKESVKISEQNWRENMTSDDCLSIELVSKEDSVIARRRLVIDIQKEKLAGCIWYSMKAENYVEGSGLVSIEKPGMKASDDMSYNNADFTDLLKEGEAGYWLHVNWLEVNSPYNQEEFFKNYLENGHVMVEVSSEIRMNGEKVEDKELKRKEVFVKDINKFCSNESSSDFLVICEGEEIPCHKVILCSRCLADMSEETSNRWTVNNSNPEAVKDMLHYLYTGEIREVETRPTELLHLASFYRLPELEMASKVELVRGLTAENAVETLVNIDKYAPDDGVVKEMVIGFIKMNARQVVEGEDWKVFVKNYEDLVTEIVKAMAN